MQNLTHQKKKTKKNGIVLCMASSKFIYGCIVYTVVADCLAGVISIANLLEAKLHKGIK